jgi:hypothetical protein
MEGPVTYYNNAYLFREVATLELHPTVMRHIYTCAEDLETTN